MYAALAPPLVLAAHDAGAANHMFAWLQPGDVPRLALAGPAMAGRPTMQLDRALEDASTLVSGTGWATAFEHEARRIARRRGIGSIAVIDHWTNYRERFVRDGEQILPDEIWVTDPYARALAERTFEGVRVVEQPNAYLAAQVAQIPAGAADPAHILYVLEPIREAWGALPEPGEFAALDHFAAHVGPNAQVRLRPHPSDPPGKYDAWIARLGARFALDSAPTLAAALGWAGTVVGCQTYAMVVALAAGRRVFTSIPPWAPACVLPHDGITPLSATNLMELP